MIVRWLFRLGWGLQIVLTLALLFLSGWLLQRALVDYLAAPWLAVLAAALLTAAKALAIPWYAFTAHAVAPALSQRPTQWLQWALGALSLLCALSFFAEQLEQDRLGSLWLLQWLTAGYVRSRNYALPAFGCALFISLLLELAQFVTLRQLALSYWPLFRLEEEHRLRLYELRLRTHGRLRLDRGEEQALRTEIQAERQRLERELRRATQTVVKD